VLYRSANDLIPDDLFLEVNGLVGGINLILKLEGLNPSGSIKLKTAISLLNDGEQRGLLKCGGRVIESSSGNLGIALSSICAIRKYYFTCVVDPNTSRHSIVLMRAFGATVAEVRERDINGGFLQTRIDFIRRRLEADEQLFWPNQHANPANPQAHYDRTAVAVMREIPDLGYLFIGAGTTGTLMGCARYVREHAPHTRIFAVDTVGSVTFGYPPGPRYIPGLGTSRRPEILQSELVDEVVMVPEADAVRMCRRVAMEHGIAVGASTGSVLAAVVRSRPDLPEGATVVAISPDSGERYLDTVYDDDWVRAQFGIVPSAVGLRPATI
jgi:cysteine synthase A